MKPCAELCYKNNSLCEKKDCRMWISHTEDLNCTEIAVKKNGSMTLKEVGERLDISYVRVTQIEKEAVNKLKKISFNKKDTNYNII